MKKIFSFAFMAVVLAAFTFVSCGSDDDDDPVVSKDKYSFESTISDGAFALYDITVTRTAGKDVKVYQYTKSGKIALSETTTVDGKSCATDAFEVEKGTKVTIKTECKLKSNWKEVIKSSPYIAAKTLYSASIGISKDESNGFKVLDDATQEMMETYYPKMLEGLIGYDSSEK